MAIQQAAQRTSGTTNLAEILERVLDKGIVIAGDIKLSLGEVEVLSLQIRLVVCSVDKAREMGLDWWVNNPNFSSRARREIRERKELDALEERVVRLEKAGGKSKTEPQKERRRAIQQGQ